TETVNRAATTVALSPSVNPAATGKSVTFTATVTAVAPGAGSPTGTVTFFDGATVLGTAAVAAGKATFATSFSTPGGHGSKAVYNGDGNFTAGSATVTETVSTGTATARFVATDTATRGSWIGSYGGQGYDIEGFAPALPSYATVGLSGASTFTWAA